METHWKKKMITRKTLKIPHKFQFKTLDFIIYNSTDTIVIAQEKLSVKLEILLKFFNYNFSHFCFFH